MWIQKQIKHERRSLTGWYLASSASNGKSDYVNTCSISMINLPTSFTENPWFKHTDCIINMNPHNCMHSTDAWQWKNHPSFLKICVGMVEVHKQTEALFQHLMISGWFLKPKQSKWKWTFQGAILPFWPCTICAASWLQEASVREIETSTETHSQVNQHERNVL